MDDAPLMEIDSGIEGHDAVGDLSIFLETFRASSLPFQEDKAFQLIDRLVRSATAIAMPVFPRPHIVEAMRAGAKAGEYSFRPAMWVSGFNGYGRRTMIREFYRTLDGNAVPIEFDITELGLPLPLLLMIEERALGADSARLSSLQKDLVEQSVDVVASRLAATIVRVAGQSRYIILRQTRVHEERAIPPEWISKVIEALDARSAPILFLTVQVPPPDQLVIQCKGKLGTLRMAGLGLVEGEKFVKSTITSIGNKNLNWSQGIVDRIARGASGNPELVTKIISLASSLPSLENLDAVIGAETEEFTSTMTRLGDWAFAQLTHEDERRALLVLDDLMLASADDISAFLSSDRPMADTLGALERVGLVERDDGDLYRLSPMLAHRLNAQLITPELVRWRNEAVRRFIETPVEIDAAGHGMVSIQARISAAMQIGAEIPEGAQEYVTAANYLQSGIRAYRANRMAIAQKLLKQAFDRRTAFTETARRETARFYGLVCARHDDEGGVNEALAILDSHYLSKPVAEFIRGFRLELAGDVRRAISHYENSRKLDEKLGQSVREGLTIRYLVGCMLRLNAPDFSQAIRLADRAAKINSTAFVLMMRARTYLHRHFRGEPTSSGQIDDWWYDYEDALADLEAHPGVKDFYFQVRAEEAMLDAGQGAQVAIDWMRQALRVSGRFDHRLRLWQYMCRSGETTERIKMMNEIEEFVSTSSSNSITGRERKKMIDFYAEALAMNGPFRKFQLDQVFPQESDSHNLSAHGRFGKNPNPMPFLGDEILSE